MWEKIYEAAGLVEACPPSAERLLTCAEFGEETNTSERFARRLVAERRIRFVKLGGRYVRIPESAMRTYVADGMVEPARRGAGR